MLNVEVINDPVAAAVALDPVRSRLLAELANPASASALSKRIGITRQKINYHLRTLEEQHLVTVANERKWGGLTEREMVATASSYVISPRALGDVASDPEREKDRLSASYLIALAARIVGEVGDLVKRARVEDKDLATLSIDTAISFATPADRASFSRELTESVKHLAAKYHNENVEGARNHRLVIGAYPSPEKKEPQQIVEVGIVG